MVSIKTATWIPHQIPHTHQVLSQSVVGASQQEAQLDEDVDSKPLAAQQQDTEATNKYEVVGTLQDDKAQKPEWVTEIVKVCISFSVLGKCELKISTEKLHQ